MSKIVEYVRSRLPGGSANNALTQMMRQDEIRSRNEAKRTGLLKRICCCTGCAGALQLYNTSFGFKECQEEVDMLTAATCMIYQAGDPTPKEHLQASDCRRCYHVYHNPLTDCPVISEPLVQMHGLTERDRTQVTENSLRIFRRRRFCGESNYMIACDPIAEGGTKLPAVSILRVSRTCSCQTTVRRICFDARHITQVEMSDAWETLELVIEVFALIFGLASWGYVLGAEPRTDREETMRNNLLVVLAVGNIFLLFVIILNFINTRFFRATQLVVDTCMPGRAMVANNRFLSEVSYKTENSATNTAQQYAVTLPHPFAQDARQVLQHWKQIADNMSTQFNLSAEKTQPTVATEADTHNLDLMVPSWGRPVAEVAAPPPGAAVEVAVPQLLPPSGDHLQAAQAAADQHQRPNAIMSQRRRDQQQAYVPPE